MAFVGGRTPANSDEVVGLVAPKRQLDGRLLTEGKSCDKAEQDPSRHGLRSVEQVSRGVLHVAQVSRAPAVLAAGRRHSACPTWSSLTVRSRLSLPRSRLRQDGVPLGPGHVATAPAD